MRKLCSLLGVLVALSFASAVRAQDKVEVFGGYSYLRLNNSPSHFNLNGWELAGTYKFNGWLGGVADFSGHYGSPFGANINQHNFLFGPQISLPAPVSPFVHALVGVADLGGPGASDHSFATALGGGMDIHSGFLLGYRLFQVDDVITHFGGRAQNDLRISTGIVLRF
jgi:opacity protein-like surface antigen